MNIIDVAREAGVSKSTVSRVLANSELVKTDTKEKVLNAIERLGFVPNTSAQQLAGKKNGVVGVITSETISDPFYGYFNDRLMKGFQKYGYDVFMRLLKIRRQAATEKSQCFMEKWCIRCRRKLCPAEKC